MLPGRGPSAEQLDHGTFCAQSQQGCTHRDGENEQFSPAQGIITEFPGNQQGKQEASESSCNLEYKHPA